MIVRLQCENVLDLNPDVFYIEIDSDKEWISSSIELEPSEDLKTMLKLYHKKYPVIDWQKSEIKSSFDWTGLWMTDTARFVLVTKEKCHLLSTDGKAIGDGWKQIPNDKGWTPWGYLERKKHGNEKGWPQVEMEQ